jgi:hypothetical protein
MTMTSRAEPTSARLRRTGELPDIENLCDTIAKRSFLLLPAPDMRSLLLRQHADALADWVNFKASWSRLVIDGYMADGGRYRARRYGTLNSVRPDRLLLVEPRQPHYQRRQYNPLNGGLVRHFEPIEDDVIRGQTMRSIVDFGCRLFSKLSPYSDWHIEAHQFRISVPESGQAPPTPEGEHRDGVSFVMMVMVDRAHVVGGITSVLDQDGHELAAFTLDTPLQTVVVNDERVRHAVSHIAANGARPGYRDVFVATFRQRYEAGQIDPNRLDGGLS